MAYSLCVIRLLEFEYSGGQASRRCTQLRGARPWTALLRDCLAGTTSLQRHSFRASPESLDPRWEKTGDVARARELYERTIEADWRV
jgi:hypothetical protein